MTELRVLKRYLRIQGLRVERSLEESEIKAGRRKLWSWDSGWYSNE